MANRPRCGRFNSPHRVAAAARAVTSGSGPLADAASITSAGKLALATVPTGATDRVVFAAPDANSVTLQPSAESDSGGSTDGTSSSTSDQPADSYSSSP